MLLTLWVYSGLSYCNFTSPANAITCNVISSSARYFNYMSTYSLSVCENVCVSQGSDVVEVELFKYTRVPL